MNKSYPLRHFYRILSAALVCVSTTTLNLPEAHADESWPAWLQEAMAKESPSLKAQEVSIGDGFFESRLAGEPIGDPQATGDGWYLARDIDTPSPLECWVFSSTVDPATTAANIAEATIQATANRMGPLNARGIEFIDMGEIDGAPYLALEWIYTVGEAPNINAGYTKVRVATIDGVTVGCGHNYLGYRETFARAFEEFVRSADIAGGEPAPDYEEIFVHRVGNQPIGVSYSSFTTDEDGDTEITMVESLLVPVDVATLNISDSWHASFARPDGTLINQVTAKSENGELTMQLSLDDMGDGTWLVSGSFQGKDINEEITATAPPVSEIGQMHAVKDLLADDERSAVTLDAWLPDVDPTRFVQTGVEVDSARRQQGHATLTLGPMSMAAQFDKEGSLMKARLLTGAAELFLDRVWTRGTLP